MSDDARIFLARVERSRARLTKRQKDLLRMMWEAEQRDDQDDAELVFERNAGYVGESRLTPPTFWTLLEAMTIYRVEGEAGGFERYRLTAEGREVARGHEGRGR